MKAALSAIGITLSLLTGFQQALIFMHFKLNREVIEREFCINKNRSELRCNGTCFLKKQLEKANEDAESGTHIIYPWINTSPASGIGFEIKTILPEIQNKIPVYEETIYTEPGRETIVPPPDSHTRLSKIYTYYFPTKELLK